MFWVNVYSCCLKAKLQLRQKQTKNKPASENNALRGLNLRNTHCCVLYMDLKLSFVHLNSLVHVKMHCSK